MIKTLTYQNYKKSKQPPYCRITSETSSDHTQSPINQRNTSSSGTSQKSPHTVNQQSFKLPVPSRLTDSGIQPSSSSQRSVGKRFNQENNYGFMEKRHCSNTTGIHQSGQYGNPAMYQNYQQGQSQIAQSVFHPQQVYQPSYVSGQI